MQCLRKINKRVVISTEKLREADSRRPAYHEVMERSRALARGLWWRGLGALLLTAAGLSAQAIRFESGGLQYQTLTRSGITIMFAELPVEVREYAVLQVAVSNG